MYNTVTCTLITQRSLSPVDANQRISEYETDFTEWSSTHYRPDRDWIETQLIKAWWSQPQPHCRIFSTVLDFGVCLDSEQYITRVSSACLCQLRCLLRICLRVKRKVTIRLVIISRLDYCNFHLASLPNSILGVLQTYTKFKIPQHASFMNLSHVTIY